MHFYSLLFSNYIISLLFYNFTILKIPQLNSIRLGSRTMGTCFISNYYSHSNSNNRIKFKRDQFSFGFELKSSKVDQLMESLKELSLLETSMLIKKIEETFGVSAQPYPPVPLQMTTQSVAPDQAYKDEDEEEDDEAVVRTKKKSFDVVITQVIKEKRMNSLKSLRKFFPDMKIPEVVQILDKLPYTVKTVTSKKEAEAVVKELEVDGMTIVIQ